MATMLWGHGQRDRGDEKTFVPDGTTVKWYADLDQNLMTRSGFTAVSSGEFGSPNDEMGPGRGTEVEILNYAVFADMAKANVVSLLNRGSNELKFVGSDVGEGHLCNDLEGCKKKGEHACNGVFGTIKAQELVILVCRGLPDTVTATPTYGSDDEDPLHGINTDAAAAITRLMTQVRSDPAAGEQTFDGYPDASKIMLGTNMQITGWLAVRWCADYGNKGQISDMFQQIQESLNNQFAEEFLALDRYKDGIVAGAISNPEAFFRALDANAGSLTTKIGAIPAIVSARQALAEKRAKFEADTWSPDDKALEAVSERNGSNVKNLADGASSPVVAGGVLALIGSGHTDQTVAYVERQGDYEEGTVTVAKGGAFSKGSITVKGISAKQSLVESIIEEFSDKKVKFE